MSERIVVVGSGWEIGVSRGQLSLSDFEVEEAEEVKLNLVTEYMEAVEELKRIQAKVEMLREAIIKEFGEGEHEVLGRKVAIRKVRRELVDVKKVRTILKELGVPKEEWTKVVDAWYIAVK